MIGLGRRKITIIRKTGGAYDGSGRWLDGSNVRLDIMASVQHESDAGGEKRDPTEDNEKIVASVKLISASEMIPGGRPGVECDQAEIDGKLYDITAVEHWNNGLLPYYEASALEVRS